METILVIDDSPLVVAVMEEMLESLGYRPVTALSGREGLALLESSKPSVAVCDLNMPEMDGRDFVRAARATNPTLPVLILTEQSEVSGVVAVMREGAFGYLLKGIEPEMLHEEIRAALARAELLASNKRLEEANRQYQAGLEKLVEQKTAEVLALQRLKSQAERMASLGTLISGVAHEINNPLSVIASSLRWVEESILSTLENVRELMAATPSAAARDSRIEDLRRTVEGDMEDATTELPQVLHEAQTSSARIADVIAKLKKLSAPVSSFGHCILSSALTQLEQSCRAKIGDRAQFRIAVSGNAERVSLSAQDLNEALVQLVSNAALAVTPGQGQIDVTFTDDPSGDLVLRVVDNGCGIPGDSIDRICDPFFSTWGPGKGSGLGLTLVRHIVEAAGGQLRFSSTAGAGTTVEVRLPQGMHGADAPAVSVAQGFMRA